LSWWGSRSSVVVEPAPIEPKRDRGEVLMEQFRAVEDELVNLNLEIREFRRKHAISTDWFQRIRRMECATLTGRPQIEARWRELFARVDKLFPARNKLLHEIALLKNGSSQ
jgi:hypothetical protein